MALQRKTAPPSELVNLFDPELYAGGFGLPEGDYTWQDLTPKIHQPTNPTTNANVGPPKLGVMITMLDVEGKQHEQFYAMGGKAHLSFAPDPNGRKGIVRVAGATGGTIHEMTNWKLLMDSLMNCGVEAAIPGFDPNDLATLEGYVYHMVPQDEPEGRKNMATNSSMSEVGADPSQQQKRFSNKVLAVTEIKDAADAAPAPTPAKKGPVAVVKPKAAVAKAAPVAAPAEDAGGDEDVKTIAEGAVAGVLEVNPAGLKKIALRTAVFKSVKESNSEEMAQAVTQEFFASEPALNSILGAFGFTVKGLDVVLVG